MAARSCRPTTPASWPTSTPSRSPGSPAFLEPDLAGVVTLGRDADDAYLDVAAQAALTPVVFKQTPLKVVFTNLHGTGGVAVGAAAPARRVRAAPGARASRL